jgi:hypothetical protein
MINAGPKGQYVQRGPAQRVITCKSDRLERPLHSNRTGPKGHYTQKEILDDKNRPEGPIPSEGIGPKDH